MHFPARRFGISAKRHFAAAWLALAIAMVPVGSLAHSPSADDAFRDTFRRTAGGWTLQIESQGKDGTWSTFASYELSRRRKK